MHASRSFSLAVLAGLALTFGVSFDAEAKKKQRIDKEDAQATATAPVSTQVESVTIPYDPNLPTFVVVVEPFDYSASGQTSGGGQGAPAGSVASGGEVYTADEDGNLRTTWSASAGPSIGNGIAKQLTTALSGWANLAIIEPDAVQKVGDGTYTAKMQPGEIGPFVIRGTITEFMETAEMETSGKGFNSRKLGLGAALVGAVTGNRTVTAVGAGVAVLGPEYKNEKLKRTGMVGMDLRVIDGRIARVAPGGSFACQGSFTTIAAGSDFSMLGVSSGGGEMAASSLGQATRVAMNDALTKISTALKAARR